MSEKIDDYLKAQEVFYSQIENPNLTDEQIAAAEAAKAAAGASLLQNPTSKMFMLDGAYNSTSSFDPEGSYLKPQFNLQFINDHMTTDSLVSLSKIHEDLCEGPTSQNQEKNYPQYITLRLDSVKKLLPYNGFYPVTRTQQLAELYQKSIGQYIRPTGSTGPMTEDLRKAGAMQAALQPLFAPGILFNSIKSGLAVDWPTYIQSAPAVSDATNTNALGFGSDF